MTVEQNGPLSGFRIVDLSWVAAGPILGAILADLGAEVIKVESRGHPDTTRFTLENESRDPESDPTFHAYNRNKLGITVNIGHAEGRRLLKLLAKKSDAVIENFFPGVLKRHGLDYESLKAEKPDLVMISLPGFGLSGPLSQTPAYAPTLTAFSGLDSLIGYPGERSLGTHVLLSDVNAGIHGAFAVLAALWHKEETGQGQLIELAQLEALISCLPEAIMDYSMNDRIPGLLGNRESGYAPRGNYRCRGEDSWVSIAVRTNDEWKGLCEVMARPELSTDTRFADPYVRQQHLPELDALVSQWTATQTAYGATKCLQEHGVAAFPCLDMEGRYFDPHFQEREVFAPLLHPRTGGDIIPNVAWKTSDKQCTLRRHAPLLGEHNHYVFGELLGFSKEEIARLEEQRILY